MLPTILSLLKLVFQQFYFQLLCPVPDWLSTGVFWTGGSLNPARSLGPAVVVHSFESYHWIYWIGPMADSLLAVVLYKLIKALEYESANDDPEIGPVPPPTRDSAATMTNGNGGQQLTDSEGKVEVWVLTVSSLKVMYPLKVRCNKRIH